MKKGFLAFILVCSLLLLHLSPSKVALLGSVYAQDPDLGEELNSPGEDELDLGEDIDPFAEGGESAGNNEELSLEEDPFATDGELSLEEDPFETEEGLDGGEDPLGLEEDFEQASAESEFAEEDIVPEFKLRTTLKHEFALISAYVESDKGGITKDDKNDLETKSHVAYNYQAQYKIQTTPFRYYFVRMISSLTQHYNWENEQYSDDYVLHLREAYIHDQKGSLRYRAGAQMFKYGKLDFDSPLDVLNMKNQSLQDFMETEESKDPAVSVKADWLGEIQTISFYIAPFRQKTGGTEYTLFQRNAEEEESGETPKDESVIRSHWGLSYQLTFDSFDVRLGAFQWFDQDNTISWEDKKSTANDSEPEDTEDVEEEEESNTDATDTEGDFSQSYEEYDSTLQFYSLELDTTIGSFVLKVEIGYFNDKNVYHYLKESDGSAYFDTVKVKHGAAAISVEKKFESVFIMPVYSYRILYDVPADTHILTYENEEDPLSEIRDLEKKQASLVIAWEISNKLSTNLVLYTIEPVVQHGFANFWTYKSANGNHQLDFKMNYVISEELKMTGKVAQTKRSALKYTYRF